MKYPPEFPAAACDAVETEALKAERDLREYRDKPETRPERAHTLELGGVRRWTDNEEDIIEYILRVGLAFGLQACQLRPQGWSLDRIRRQTQEFFRRLTIDAYHKYVLDLRRHGFLDTLGNIEPEVTKELEKSVEWHQLEEALLATTERPPAQPSQPSDPHPSIGVSGSASLAPGKRNPLAAEGSTDDFLAELFDQFDQEEQAEIRAAEESTKDILAQGETAAKDRLRAAGSRDVPDWVRQPQDNARADAAGVVFSSYVQALWGKTDVTRTESIAAFLVQIERLIAPILTRYGWVGQEFLDVLRKRYRLSAQMAPGFVTSTQGMASTVESASDSQQSGNDYAKAEASHADLEKTGGTQPDSARSSVIAVHQPTLLTFSGSWSEYRRTLADGNAVLKRKRLKNDSVAVERLLQNAREWAKAKLKPTASEVQDVFELKDRVVSQTYDRLVPNPGDFPYGEFVPALWEEGWPSLEDRAIEAILERAASGPSGAAGSPCIDAGVYGKHPSFGGAAWNADRELEDKLHEIREVYLTRIASCNLEERKRELVKLVAKLYEALASKLLKLVRKDHDQDAIDFDRDHMIRASVVWQILDGIPLDGDETKAIELALEACRSRWYRRANQMVKQAASEQRYAQIEPLTSQQKDLLFAIVEAHLSGDGEPFIFVRDVSQSSLIYPRGRCVRINATEVDFHQLAGEGLVTLVFEPRLGGKPTQLGIDTAASLRESIQESTLADHPTAGGSASLRGGWNHARLAENDSTATPSEVQVLDGDSGLAPKPAGDSEEIAMGRAHEPPSALAAAELSRSPTAAEIREQRRVLRDNYKSECKTNGVRVTDAMIAEAANTKWHGRTAIQKWVGCDPRYNGEPDRLIRSVFARKHHIPAKP
jgi:hypothetical protein